MSKDLFIGFLLGFLTYMAFHFAYDTYHEAVEGWWILRARIKEDNSQLEETVRSILSEASNEDDPEQQADGGPVTVQTVSRLAEIKTKYDRLAAMNPADAVGADLFDKAADAKREYIEEYYAIYKKVPPGM